MRKSEILSKRTIQKKHDFDNDYPFTIRHLSEEEGGGYLAEALDLNGCIADGETIEEAIHNLQDAIKSWMRTANES